MPPSAEDERQRRAVPLSTALPDGERDLRLFMARIGRAHLAPAQRWRKRRGVHALIETGAIFEELASLQNERER